MFISVTDDDDNTFSDGLTRIDISFYHDIFNNNDISFIANMENQIDIVSHT